MDFTAVLSSTEKAKVQMQVDSINGALSDGREYKPELGKEDFLKILITQLSHQDPTEPMEDKEFIAQMAQFSTLEQMTNMNQEFSRLTGMLASGQAVSMLGKQVEIINGDQVVSGVITEIRGREYPQVLVNGKYYDMSQVEKVKE